MHLARFVKHAKVRKKSSWSHTLNPTGCQPSFSFERFTHLKEFLRGPLPDRLQSRYRSAEVMLTKNCKNNFFRSNCMAARNNVSVEVKWQSHFTSLHFISFHWTALLPTYLIATASNLLDTMMAPPWMSQYVNFPSYLRHGGNKRCAVFTLTCSDPI